MFALGQRCGTRHIRLSVRRRTPPQRVDSRLPSMPTTSTRFMVMRSYAKRETSTTTKSKTTKSSSPPTPTVNLVPPQSTTPPQQPKTTTTTTTKSKSIKKTKGDEIPAEEPQTLKKQPKQPQQSPKQDIKETEEVKNKNTNNKKNNTKNNKEQIGISSEGGFSIDELLGEPQQQKMDQLLEHAQQMTKIKSDEIVTKLTQHTDSQKQQQQKTQPKQSTKDTSAKKTTNNNATNNNNNKKQNHVAEKISEEEGEDDGANTDVRMRITMGLEKVIETLTAEEQEEVGQQLFKVAQDINDIRTEGKNPVPAIHEGIDKAIEESLKTRDITCRKGCNHCCHQIAFVTAEEGFILASKFLEMYSGDTYNQKVEYMKSQLPYCKEGEELEFWKLPREKSACVFLDAQGLCSVYQYRPAACRLFASFSEPYMCSKEATAGPEGGTIERAFSLEGEVLASAQIVDETVQYHPLQQSVLSLLPVAQKRLEEQLQKITKKQGKAAGTQEGEEQAKPKKKQSIK